MGTEKLTVFQISRQYSLNIQTVFKTVIENLPFFEQQCKQYLNSVQQVFLLLCCCIITVRIFFANTVLLLLVKVGFSSTVCITVGMGSKITVFLPA